MAGAAGTAGVCPLDPAGIENTNLIHTKFYAWEDIANVLDEPSKKRTRKAVVLALKDGSEAIIEGADLYVPGGVGLYWMVRHYWRHLEDRAELADGRALERLHDQRFDTV